MLILKMCFLYNYRLWSLLIATIASSLLNGSLVCCSIDVYFIDASVPMVHLLCSSAATGSFCFHYSFEMSRVSNIWKNFILKGLK